MIDKQNIDCRDSPRSLETREGDNGFIPVSVSTRSSAPQRFYSFSTTGATVGYDSPSLTAAVLSSFTDCNDVVTKPKLDKHWAVCRASFDCIDCSKHFATPADYKGHTSCISEAEKYQKALYNGGVSEYTVQDIPDTLTTYKNRVALKGTVETNDRGSRAEEGNGGITDSDGNNEP